MKKFLVVLLVSCMLTGCGSSEGDSGKHTDAMKNSVSSAVTAGKDVRDELDASSDASEETEAGGVVIELPTDGDADGEFGGFDEDIDSGFGVDIDYGSVIDGFLDMTEAEIVEIVSAMGEYFEESGEEVLVSDTSLVADAANLEYIESAIGHTVEGLVCRKVTTEEGISFYVFYEPLDDGNVEYVMGLEGSDGSVSVFAGVIEAAPTIQPR